MKKFINTIKNTIDNVLNTDLTKFYVKLQGSSVQLRSTIQKYKDLIKNFDFKRITYHIDIWLQMTKNSFMVMLAQKKLFVLFLLGKLIRFILFIIFLIFLVRGSNGLAGYDANEVVFFFLTFNLVDILSQFLYREVYRFRPLVVSGDFDLILVKPFNALFRVMAGGADVIDFLTIPPLIAVVIYVGNLLDPTFIQVFYFMLLTLNSLVIATAFHIVVLSFGILTLEVDHVIWIYRDLTSLGRLPIDIYKMPLNAILTYLIPVGIMMSFPAKALLGILSPFGVFSSMFVAGASMMLSLSLWRFSMKRYASASS